MSWPRSDVASLRPSWRCCVFAASKKRCAVQDRPTAVELLDALGAFMRDRSVNARDRWERFQFQVAANSIAIISRELQMEDGFMRLEWEGLDILLGAEAMPPEQPAFVARLQQRSGDLAERIRDGELDDREDALL